MMCKIRPAKLNESGIIVKILNKVTLYLHQRNINQWTYLWKPNEIDSEIRNKNMYVVTMDELIVGTFSLRKMESNAALNIKAPDNLYLYRIALLPEYQGKNLGAKIINYAFDVSKNSGKTLYLDCWAGNKNLKSFYSKSGFDYYGDFKEEDYMISVFKYER